MYLYQFHNFGTINDAGKKMDNEILQFLCKELLGSIRAKYQSIPVPGETSLDGDELGRSTTRKRTTYHRTKRRFRIKQKHNK